MASSLVRFANRVKKSSDGQPVSWGRVDRDGFPFRGPLPHFTEEEFEARTVKVADPHSEVFNLSDAQQKSAYLNVLDGAANGWFQILYLKRPGEFDKSDLTKAYVEWLEFYMEDGTMAPHMTNGVVTMEQQNGAYQMLPASTVSGSNGEAG